MLAMIPAGRCSVRLADVAEPAPADGEALVAVAAYSVNRGETLLLEAPPTGWRPGKDVAGTVVAAAADGTGPAAGTRVVGHAPAAGWAERVAVATSSLAVLPAELASTTAAALPLAGLTALRLLRRAGPLLGRRLLITGASGGVGHYLVELAVAAGAEVTAVSATAERGARLRELGAHTVTDVADADGRFDVAMESVGGALFPAVRRRVRPGGLVLWFGQASREPVTLDFFDWVDDTAGARIEQFHYLDGDDQHGSGSGSAAGTGTATGDDLATLVRLVHHHRLHPQLGTVAPWQSTPRVIDELRGRRIRGNAVVTLP